MKNIFVVIKNCIKGNIPIYADVINNEMAI